MKNNKTKEDIKDLKEIVIGLLIAVALLFIWHGIDIVDQSVEWKNQHLYKTCQEGYEWVNETTCERVCETGQYLNARDECKDLEVEPILTMDKSSFTKHQIKIDCDWINANLDNVAMNTPKEMLEMCEMYFSNIFTNDRKNAK